jgi:hypothetical protein
MGPDVEQNNDFTIGFCIPFNREDNRTIIAARAGLKTVKLAAQFVDAQGWGKYVCFHLLKSVFNALLEIDVSPDFLCGMPV